MSLSQRRALVDSAAPGSLRQQCQWVGLHRSAYYYQPVVADPEDLLQVQLIDAVEHLPQPAQTIFRLSRYEYLSTQAIAVQLNLSPKMVEYHLTRALRQLRSQLKEFFALLLVFFLPFP